MTERPKAIETVYNGYRFRSRLEARWAVSDTLGVKYEYEKEGYELPNPEEGQPPIRYLPDFWLPDLRCFVEIKPTMIDYETDEGNEIDDKVTALALATGYPVYVFFGECWIPSWRDADGEPTDSAWVFYRHQGRYWYDGAIEDETITTGLATAHWWCECIWCGAVGIQHHGNYTLLPCGCQRAHDSGIATGDAVEPTSPRVVAAYLAARQARFEHGQTPRPPKRGR